MEESIKQLIAEHTALYKKAEEVFKQGQLKTNVVPLQPLNEFRYCARAQVDALNYLATGGEDYAELLKLLEPGTRSLKCAINDTVDFLVAFARSCIDKIRTTYPGFDIGTEYGREEFLTLLEALAALDDGIAHSRGSNGNARLATYYVFFEKEIPILIKFLNRINFIEDAIAGRYEIEQKRLTALKEQEAAQREEKNSREQASIAASEQARASHNVMVWTLIATLIGIIIGATVAIYSTEIKGAFSSSQSAADSGNKP